MDNFFESLRLTWVGWVFAFFIVGATILAGRWLVGLGMAKFNREVPGELDGTAPSADVAAPVMPRETKTLFDRADELLKQGTQSEDNQALIEAIDTYRRGLALLARPESPLQWALAHTNLAVALETLGERENGTARLEEAVEVYREALKEYTREHEPLDWAATQMNLGNALARLGERESGTARLEEARAARLGRRPDESRQCAESARRAGERDEAARGGRRSLSRGLAGVDPRSRA